MTKIISQTAITRRRQWISFIKESTGTFDIQFVNLQEKLDEEIRVKGADALIDHLRLAGDIPESFRHDSGEEKLYSKYTDLLLTKTFHSIGLRSITLNERGDSADVEVIAADYSFVADAKAFRLSRTAKNQKDFKIQAMANWKRDNPYALVVAPIYHLPDKSSQIYHQAATNDVCIFTYSHLAVLLAFAQQEGKKPAIALLKRIFESISKLLPSKDACIYWRSLNGVMLDYSESIRPLWLKEKQAANAAIAIAKEDALQFLSSERRRIMQMTHEAAIQELLQIHKIENKIAAINSVAANGLMEEQR